MAASTIKPDHNSRERGTGATTLRRRLWDLSPGSLPLRSPRHLVKVLSHSVHDAFALVALAQLEQHHRWERKKKRADEGTGLQADPPPSTETMPQSLKLTHTPFSANCIIGEVQPLFMCFNGESNLPLKMPFLQFRLAYKSFSMTYLETFFDDRYHLQFSRFVNCSAPELHFSTCFFGNWPQNSRMASCPILLPEASWAFGQFLFLIGN